MSQRRNKFKGKDHNQVALKQDHNDSSLHSYNYIFDSIHPPESYTSPPAVRIVSSIHIAVLNIMLVIGQYIVLFGNYVWRYETRLFLVSILLSIEKVTLDIIVFFCDNKSEETKNRIRQIGKIIVILCCTILPRYHYDTIYDIIISISIIVLSIYISIRNDDEIDETKSFYTNIFSIALFQLFIACAYPIMYYLVINKYAGDDLLPMLFIAYLLEFILAAQEVLFNSHIYASLYKYQGYWTCLPSKYRSSIEGRIEQWRPNHIYPFGSVVLYQDYTITAMGYLNNVTPFIPYLELPFRSVFEKEKVHKLLINAHIAVTGFCCFQMIIQHYQLKYAVMSVISIISLILTFPLHTMAFN